MTKSELIIKMKDVPDDAVVFIYADHGQTNEYAGIVEISSTPEHYWKEDIEEIDWRGNEKCITAVRIS